MCRNWVVMLVTERHSHLHVEGRRLWLACVARSASKGVGVKRSSARICVILTMDICFTHGCRDVWCQTLRLFGRWASVTRLGVKGPAGDIL